MADVIAALLPVFFALAVGYLCGKTRIVDNRHVESLNTVVMSVALPIALFVILAGAQRTDVVEHGTVAAAVLVVMAATYGIFYALQRVAFRQRSDVAAVDSLTVGFPNTAAVGLPIADAVLGRTGALAVAVSLAVGAITLSPLTIVLVERASSGAGARKPSIGPALLKALRTPVVIAPILGIAWSLSGLPFPALAGTTLREIGNLTAGLALFVTGLVLSAQRLPITVDTTLATLASVVLRPVLALGVVALFHLGGPMAEEIIVLMAVPSGFFGVLLAVGRHVPSTTAGPALFYSTVLSALTLTAVILLLASR